ncbi:14998_t:CDS:2, partial [Dentiscutata erythropus]
DEEEPENAVDLNSLINTLVEINFNEFLQIETEVSLSVEEATPAEVTTEFENHSNTNDLTLLVNDLKQTPAPTTRTITNSFSGGTWKKPSRPNLESNNPLEIKTFIQKAQSTRNAKKTWKGALKIYELLKQRPKEIIFQL